jgi:hypothetical protein
MAVSQCFKDSDPLKPQPDKVVEIVQTTQAGPLGKYYDKIVVLDIEFTNEEDLEKNWNPMRKWCRLEPGAMHKLIWYVREVKRKLPDYKVGLWSTIPSPHTRFIYNKNPDMRLRWWQWCRDLTPLGKTVDFTSPHFYWILQESHAEFYTHAQRESAIAQVCAASHDLYGKPCYPWIWPECYWAFQKDPWPDTEERRLARQMTREDMQNTIGACLKHGDGFMLWSQPLRSAAQAGGGFNKNPTPFRFNDPWVQVLMGDICG